MLELFLCLKLELLESALGQTVSLKKFQIKIDVGIVFVFKVGIIRISSGNVSLKKFQINLMLEFVFVFKVGIIRISSVSAGSLCPKCGGRYMTQRPTIHWKPIMTQL
jgi:hypothetical protein